MGHVVRWEGKQGPFFMTLRQTEGGFVTPAPSCCRSSVMNGLAATLPEKQSPQPAIARPSSRKRREGAPQGQAGYAALPTEADQEGEVSA